jgi:hypothetical protein
VLDQPSELVVARQRKEEGKSIICEAGWSPEEAYRNVCLRAASLGMFEWVRLGEEVWRNEGSEEQEQ